MTDKYLKIKEASQFLGVTSQTLRNWDKQGRFNTYRHPLNHYRLYKKEDLEKILSDIKKSKG